jgi:predicted nucleic acid-binding protein
MSTLVDSNVLIDVIDRSSVWQGWSSSRLLQAAEAGPVIPALAIIAPDSHP